MKSLPPIECIFGDHTAMDRYAILEWSSRRLATQLHLTLWRHQYSLAASARSDDTSNVKTAPFCEGRVIAIHSLPIAKCTCIGAILGVDKPPVSAKETPKFRVLALTTAPPNEDSRNDNAIEDPHQRQIKKLFQTVSVDGSSVSAEKSGIRVRRWLASITCFNSSSGF